MVAAGASMDLTSSLTNFQHARTVSAVQMKVARKVLDAQEMQGAAMVKLIEAAGKTAAKAGDALVAAATGVGGLVDVHA